MEMYKSLTDEAVLAELGARLAARRIDMQLTQAEVADEAGIGKRTLERMEAGYSSQLTNLVRVLRVLDAFGGLENLLPEAGPRPMDELMRGGKPRQRASGKRGSSSGAPSWRWGDDE